MDEDELEELSLQRSLPAGARCPYISGEYWSRQEDGPNSEDVYWASVDLEKFYPSINIIDCASSIVGCIPEEMRLDVSIVLKLLTNFEIDFSGWDDSELECIELVRSNSKFNKVPTGLLISGFLANAAMLKVDHLVDMRLPRGRVAHFRYVDDHVILAKSFEELLGWVETYKSILKQVGPGPDINHSKTEPSDVGSLLVSLEVDNKSFPLPMDLIDKAKESSRLDTEFPAPLITRTIALVSAIGRTDFTILEDNELGILSQQLEHLLLVDLPETEIPERTRLAFAATRLARVAEARLASPDMLYGDIINREGHRKHSAGTNLFQQGNKIDAALIRFTGIQDAEGRKRLESASNRVFGLLRRVLRKSPDRVRLWTNALVVSRRLGVTGVGQLFKDIEVYADGPINSLAANYIFGNSYAVLASEALRASKILTDGDAAGWRRAASLRFLSNFSKIEFGLSHVASDAWFVEKSYNQFCVAIYCAEWLISNEQGMTDGYGLAFSKVVTARGYDLLSSSKLSPEDRVSLSWWACQFELINPVRRAPPLVLHIANLLKGISQAESLWSFFPQDVPDAVLQSIAKSQRASHTLPLRDGWWIDAIRHNEATEDLADKIGIIAPAARIRNTLRDWSGSERLPLPIWAEKIWSTRPLVGGDDWRLGEWTCLEIIRQAAKLFAQDEVFDLGYLEQASSKNNGINYRCALPFNFTLPADLAGATPISWQSWRDQIRRDGAGVVKFVSKKNALHDYRYSPLVLNPIGSEQNPIRGLGLCLLGLLSKTFYLPVQWNGPGHERVLGNLSKLLRSQITYSSATLGVLEACLQPRASENIMAGVYQFWVAAGDNDTENDPVKLLNPSQLANAIEVVQAELEANQISTFNHSLRQATPVSLMHLTGTDWDAFFGGSEI